MDTKGVLVALITATVVNAASASIAPAIEKQEQAKMMTNLIGDLTTVMVAPECTIRGSLKEIT